MKKIIISAFTFLSLTGIYAQVCPANDSTFMGSGTATDVYYSLKQFAETGNGTVKTAANNNWHLAFSVQPSQFPSNPANGVAIRVNSVLGENSQMGTTGTKLVKLSGANPANWWAVDTAGLSALPELLDSDSTWNLSAFTSGYPSAGPFNFMWGTYNQTSHNVESNNNVYVLYNKSAGWYKKIHVKSLVWDSMWHVVMSNIDNSDSVYLNINKNDYSKRNFVYYNVLTKSILDREPDNDKWDLLWTKYKTVIDFMGGKVPYSVSGVLSNRGVTVAKNLGKKCNEVWLSNKTAAYQDRISQIGWDWKAFVSGTYVINDTFIYFINGLDAKTYKMSMKTFTGGTKGRTEFNVYEATLRVEDAVHAAEVSVYPNPASGSVSIQTDAEIISISLMDVHGRQFPVSAGKTVDISGLSAGTYFLVLTSSKGISKHIVIKQ